MNAENKEGKRFCVIANDDDGFHEFNIGDEVECVGDDGSDCKNYRRVSDSLRQWVSDSDLIEIVETYKEGEEGEEREESSNG